MERIREVGFQVKHVPSKREFVKAFRGRFVGAIYATFGSYTAAVKQAGYSQTAKDDVTGKGAATPEHTDDELIDYYKRFFEINGRVPRCSDHGRGLLPSYESYHNRFGGVQKARLLAGLPALKKVGFHDYVEVVL